MVRYDLVDDSCLQWIEARYHWTRMDMALQVQLTNGRPGSDFGVAPDRRVWQLLARYFF